MIAGFALRKGIEAWRGDACAVPVAALTGERDVEHGHDHEHEHGHDHEHGHGSQG